MIARIISRQAQRRDQFVWMLSLRNEKPLNNDFAKGLISINLSNNMFGSDTADELANALQLDCYLRSINLANNSITEDGCKKLIHALRRNTTLLNCDLRGNPGYEDDIIKRINLKLVRNITQIKEMNLASHELHYLSQFIAVDMFNVNIPQNIIEWFNYKEKYGLSEEEKKKSPRSPRRNSPRSRPASKSHKKSQSTDLNSARNLKKENNYLKKSNHDDDIFKNLSSDIPLKNIPEQIKKVVEKHGDCKCSNDFGKIINALKTRNNELVIENLNIRKNLILNKSTSPQLKNYLNLEENLQNQFKQENLSLGESNNNISSGQVNIKTYINKLINLL